MESFEFAARAQALPLAQPPDPHATRPRSRRSGSSPPHERTFRHGLWKLFLGTWLYWLIGSFFTRIAAPALEGDDGREEPIIDTDGAATEASSTPTPTSTTTTRASSGTSSAPRSTTGCVAANYVESLGAEREGDAWVVRTRDRRDRGARSDPRARADQRLRPVRRRAQRRSPARRQSTTTSSPRASI